MAVLIMFNIFVVMINPNISSILRLDYIDILITVISILLAGGATQLLLGETVIRIVSVTLLLFNIMFQVNVYGFTIGLGLINTVFDVFVLDGSFIMWMGYIITSILSIMCFFSGLMIVAESA